MCFAVLQYGNDGRAWIESDPNAAACTECTRQETGYSFSWQFTNDNYSVPSISPVMANASTDCLAKYSQTLDGAWCVYCCLCLRVAPRCSLVAVVVLGDLPHGCSAQR